jgi:hypothetical protein
MGKTADGHSLKFYQHHNLEVTEVKLTYPNKRKILLFETNNSINQIF